MSEKKVFSGSRILARWHLKRWQRENRGKIEIFSVHDLHGYHFDDGCHDDQTYIIVYYQWIPQELPERPLSWFEQLALAIFPMA